MHTKERNNKTHTMNKGTGIRSPQQAPVGRLSAFRRSASVCACATACGCA
jgi:hypothetical protein